MRWAAATGDSRSALVWPGVSSSPLKNTRWNHAWTCSQESSVSDMDALGRPRAWSKIICYHLLWTWPPRWRRP